MGTFRQNLPGREPFVGQLMYGVISTCRCFPWYHCIAIVFNMILFFRCMEDKKIECGFFFEILYKSRPAPCLVLGE